MVSAVSFSKLAFARGEGAAKALALLVAAMHTLTTMLAHPEYRYLLPFFALLAPWAGWALAAAFQPRRWRAALRQPGTRWQIGLAALAVAGLLYSSAPTFVGEPNRGTDYVSGIKAAYHLVRANLAHLFGDAAGEQDQLAATLDNFDAADLRVRLADIRRSKGRTGEAVALYQQALDSDRHYWPAALSLGATRRAGGDSSGATAAFARVEPSFRTQAQDWAWTHLGWDLRDQISVDGADYGYVRGFFEPERDEAHAYRWSSGHAALHLYTPATATTLTLTLRASSPAQRLSLSVGDQMLGNYQPTLAWQRLAIPLPPSLQSAHDYQVQLTVDAKPPSDQDTRPLGVAVAAAALSTPLVASLP